MNISLILQELQNNHPEIWRVVRNYVCLYYNNHPLMIKNTPPQQGHKAGVNSPIFV
jgi:hypothetical protein